MTIDSIINYLHISDYIASSGQPSEAHFKSIAQANYQVVINLSMPDSDKAIANEGSVVTSCKMTYVHIPVPFNAPSPAHLRQFFNVMKAFAGEKRWVHCALNYRVSGFLYQYRRLVDGLSEEEARQVMHPSWSPDSVWKRFLTLTEDKLQL